MGSHRAGPLSRPWARHSSHMLKITPSILPGLSSLILLTLRNGRYEVTLDTPTTAPKSYCCHFQRFSSMMPFEERRYGPPQVRYSKHAIPAAHEEDPYRRVLQRVTDIQPATPRQDNMDDNETSMPAQQESAQEGLEEVPEKNRADWRRSLSQSKLLKPILETSPSQLTPPCSLRYPAIGRLCA